MALPQNKTIPILALLALVGVILLIAMVNPNGWMGKLGGGFGKPVQQAADQDRGSESVESLASDVSSVEDKLSETLTELEALRAQEQAREQESAKQFAENLSTTVSSLQEKYDETVNGLIGEIRGLSKSMKEKPPAPAKNSIPIGSGLDTGVVEGGFRVYRPLGSAGAASSGPIASARKAVGGLLGKIPTPFQSGDATVTQAKVEADSPVYTVPENSTLMGATAMTALVGRVPVSGVVFQPLPFKVVVGKENLTANDMWLPDVEQMIFEGSASGEATLKCVRGIVESVTFVFRDGTIRTQRAQGNDANQPGDGLGWISDDRGYPCIPGQFVTDAPKVLASMTVAGILTGYADAIADQESAVVISGTGVSRVVTGDSTRYALGRGAQTGFDELAREIARRARDRYDAVVLQPGATVAVHISKQLRIDYERGPESRKINYMTNYRDAPAARGVD